MTNNLSDALYRASNALSEAANAMQELQEQINTNTDKIKIQELFNLELKDIFNKFYGG